ncbi:hypothetical protein ACLB1S_22195 [Escherichia coli]
MRHKRRFPGINEAMIFRAEIEEPRRAELRALGLNCKRSGSGPTNGTIEKSADHQERDNGGTASENKIKTTTVKSKYQISFSNA